MKSLATLTVALFVAVQLLPLAADPPPTSTTNSPFAKLPPPVQVDVSKLLNARVVTTLTNGKIVPAAIDIDGVGGVIAKSAAMAAGSDNPHTVPDDSVFPATTDHPLVVLHYSNADGVSNQVRRSPLGSDDDYAFDVPPKNYANMFLFFTSGLRGPAPLKVTLTYQDGTTEDREIVCPDWYMNLKPGNKDYKDCVYLAYNLAKWLPNNTVREKWHHNIFGLDVHPNSAKILLNIHVHKTHPLVCFWGATGQPAN